MVRFDVAPSARGNYCFVVAHDPDAKGELAKGVCIATFVGADALERAHAFVAAKQVAEKDSDEDRVES